MSEQVIRHRGGGRDENSKLTADGMPVPLTAIGVAPGSGGSSAGSSGGSDRIERARTGEDTQCVVYLPPGTDLVNSDELTVRGKRYHRITVNDWNMNGRGGLEVLCSRGQG
ncbi:hypothetical protein R2360_00275 [Mycobacteroides chelonae]|nr:hypothetical protein [Mycobacteroides chelonae]MEC4845893.1 hypothetical protein [Mycobacteroides chelonae]